MANLLGGVWSLQHRRVFLRHSAFMVPPVFPSQGMVISQILKRIIVIVVVVGWLIPFANSLRPSFITKFCLDQPCVLPVTSNFVNFEPSRV